MDYCSKLASKFALALSVIGLIAMTAIIGWQVFARYILNASPSWTEQAALLLMLWFMLFAAAAGVREGFHIRLSLLQDNLAPARRKYLRILASCVVLIFSLFMVKSGCELVIATWEHALPALGLSRGVSYIPLVACGALSAFFALEHIIADWRGQTVEAIWS